MSTKSEILEILEAHRGEFVSGEQLARALDISRNAVWKGVSALKGDGFPIEAVKSRGYMLPDGANVTEAGIRKYLGGRDADILIYNSVTSTNTVAKELAAAGAADRTVVVALEQTEGRGRYSRKFYSDRATGVYFSVILRPAREMVPMLTVMAAVAVCEAIERASGKTPSIKWVNDVYVGKKKCTGILTEAVSDLETGGVEYAVVGIGVNVKTPVSGFPAEIADIAAAALDDVRDAFNKTVAYTLDSLFAMYGDFDRAAVAKAYRERSFLISERVTVHGADGARPAVVLDIDDECRLVVRFDDGSVAKLNSGEVSVRW